jgi:uncharacterized surface protein with fasciclin (FAS1) repeats
MKRSVRLLSLLAVALLLLAACTSADETGETTTGSEGLEEAVEEESPPSGSVAEESVPPEVSEPADGGTSSDQTLADVAADNPQLSQLTQAIEAAGLGSALQEAGPLTVFAPNDDAFGQLNQDDLTALLADPSQLSDILQYHVVEGSYPSSDLSDGQTLTTLQGEDLTISVDGSTVMVDDATVVGADIEAGNGVIHIIDGVLRPPSS